MSGPNPFLSRHSDLPGHYEQFAQTFATQMFLALPPLPWRQLIVLRSAPGAGKTSLMQSMTAGFLSWVSANHTRVPQLRDALADFGVLDGNDPALLGLRINLVRDFPLLADIGGSSANQQGLFNRLLDARIVSETLRGALLMAGKDPTRLELVSIRAETGSAAHAAIESLGGNEGADLLAYAAASEREILASLDRLVGDDSPPSGHHSLYSLRALSGTAVTVDGTTLNVTPLVMLDEGHIITRTQRQHLLAQLCDRELTVARWLGLQSKAFDGDELVGAGQKGREYEVIELEAVGRRERARGQPEFSTDGAGRLSPQGFRKMLISIADKRASPALDRMIQGPQQFSTYWDVSADDPINQRYQRAIERLRERLLQRDGANTRYSDWIALFDAASGREGLAALAELEVIINRDEDRSQHDLFDVVLPVADLESRRNSAVREGALLRACRSFRVPYYHGSDTITRLASGNIEQFLELCADFIAHIQNMYAANRPLRLTADVQDKIIKAAGRRYWRELEQLPHGHLVQRLVAEIASIGESEAARPRLPYPPGVTGTALSNDDRDRLLRPPRADREELLYLALTSGIAHNVFWIERDYRVKNRQWLVVYLNRLLCPEFGLPLTLGGFRERPLDDILDWFNDYHLPAGDL